MENVQSSPALTPYERIREGIFSGEFAPGQPLTEKHLAQWCGVSRTPVREALGRLERDGLVTWTERGTVVRERTPEEILDIYDARVVLEALAARTAAERRSEHDLMMLSTIVDQASAVDPQDIEAKLGSSRAFHTAVRKAAHNESLIDLLGRLNLQLARHADGHPTLGQDGRWGDAIDMYASLFRAIEGRDGESAHEISRRYFTEARKLRLQALAGLA